MTTIGFWKGAGFMGEHLVITIGRHCGAKGNVIGRKLAEDMGVKCYNKELLAEAAKHSGTF